ncbi:MAG: hypothetical protein PW789_06830 [Edaphobacter sp.]|uniref:hypothetical protein n=1 Tax=Edaphobacter sp. TaxID=1934404 RepID=UPI00239151F0|nr:hypothetical protein [Edaphobacter sp.]MDE1176308.1 hypothetical protein [Edaphobacter sp.]
MDRSIFMLWCLLGIGVALGVLHVLGRKRRTYIPSFVWSFSIIVGSVTCLYGLSHSTAPSFSHRVTAVGKASDCVERRFGRSLKFAFGFVPEDGNPTNIETQIIMPHWGNTEIFNGRTLQITYINDTSRRVSNEAVEIEILSGDNAGWHDSLDARPLGIWLAIPIGAAIAGFGYIGFKYRKDDLRSIEPSETT